MFDYCENYKLRDLVFNISIWMIYRAIYCIQWLMYSSYKCLSPRFIALKVTLMLYKKVGVLSGLRNWFLNYTRWPPLGKGIVWGFRVSHTSGFSLIRSGRRILLLWTLIYELISDRYIGLITKGFKDKCTTISSEHFSTRHHLQYFFEDHLL